MGTEHAVELQLMHARVMLGGQVRPVFTACAHLAQHGGMYQVMLQQRMLTQFAVAVATATQ